MSKRLRRLGIATAVMAALAITGASAGVASAAPGDGPVTFAGNDVPTTATIAPGATGMVLFTYKNTGATVDLPADNMKIVFRAPGNSTFTKQFSVPVQYDDDSGFENWSSDALRTQYCRLGDSDQTLTCNVYTSNDSTYRWFGGNRLRMWLQIAVDPSAPYATTLTPGSVSTSFTDQKSQTAMTISDGTLNIATPSVAGDALANTGQCVDSTNAAANNSGVNQYHCTSGDPDQVWVVQDGTIMLKRTADSSNPLCLDSSSSAANDSGVILNQCGGLLGLVPNDNQNWVFQDDGSIMLKRTAGSSNPLCLDSTDSRADRTGLILYQCQSGNANQRWVFLNGNIKLLSTM